MKNQHEPTQEELFAEMVQTIQQLDKERTLLVKNAADVLHLQQSMGKTA